MDVGDRAGGRFELEQFAGAGSMARVFRAKDLSSGETVAVKVLRPLGVEYERRFIREANVLADLEHPGIVRYLDHGSAEGGDHYLAMEWLEGEDLRQRLARAPMSVEESIRLVRLVCAALSIAHERGIVHRDLKPSNLFLPDGSVERVKILDFGVARLLDPRATQTRIGTRVGTVQYMAPEQARGSSDVGTAADVWSMGCVLFECLTGRPAFPGENDVAVLAKLVLEDPPRAQALKGNVPPAVDDLLITLLAKTPTRRPADASAVVKAIDDLPSAPGKTLVDDEPPQGMVSTAEKRLLCIVMVGPEVASSDPDTTAPLAVSPNRKRGVLERSLGVYGGVLEVLGEGALVLTFSGAGSATDLAARAARCALTAHQVLPSSSIAMAMGWGELRGKTPVGEVIDAAAALLWTDEQSGSGGVRIDRISLGLLDAHFVIERDEQGHQLTHEIPGLDASRTLLGKHRSFVGRNREMTTLQALFHECVEESVARVALVSGHAGAGKSRLRFELLRSLRESDPDLAVLFARGEPIRGGAPFGLLAEALKRAAGIENVGRMAHKRARVENMVGRHLEPEDSARVSERLVLLPKI